MPTSVLLYISFVYNSSVSIKKLWEHIEWEVGEKNQALWWFFSHKPRDAYEWDLFSFKWFENGKLSLRLCDAV